MDIELEIDTEAEIDFVAKLTRVTPTEIVRRALEMYLARFRFEPAETIRAVEIEAQP
jgi:predicted transcriptional regulator